MISVQNINNSRIVDSIYVVEDKPLFNINYSNISIQDMHDGSLKLIVKSNCSHIDNKIYVRNDYLPIWFKSKLISNNVIIDNIEVSIKRVNYFDFEISSEFLIKRKSFSNYNPRNCLLTGHIEYEFDLDYFYDNGGKFLVLITPSILLPRELSKASAAQHLSKNPLNKIYFNIDISEEREVDLKTKNQETLFLYNHVNDIYQTDLIDKITIRKTKKPDDKSQLLKYSIESKSSYFVNDPIFMISTDSKQIQLITNLKNTQLDTNTKVTDIWVDKIVEISDDGKQINLIPIKNNNLPGKIISEHGTRINYSFSFYICDEKGFKNKIIINNVASIDEFNETIDYKTFKCKDTINNLDKYKEEWINEEKIVLNNISS